MVQTVREPVDEDDLGRTYMHEHIFVLTPDVQQNDPEERGDEEARVADAVARLRAVAAQGIRTMLVDTPRRIVTPSPPTPGKLDR